MRITPEIVGKEMGVSAATVREMMDEGKLDIDIVLEGGGRRKVYIIFPKALYDVTGIKIDYEPPEAVESIDYRKIAEELVDIAFNRIKKMCAKSYTKEGA